jgi:hypothetical protein
MSSLAVAQQPSAKAPRKLMFATGETIVEAGRDGSPVPTVIERRAA